jgi:hypothetical protein
MQYKALFTMAPPDPRNDLSCRSRLKNESHSKKWIIDAYFLECGCPLDAGGTLPTGNGATAVTGPGMGVVHAQF